MLRAIQLGSCVSVQGLFVGFLPDGRMQVRVGNRIYSGYPISTAKAA